MQPGRAQAGVGQRPDDQLGERGGRALKDQAADPVRDAVAVEDGQRPVGVLAVEVRSRARGAARRRSTRAGRGGPRRRGGGLPALLGDVLLRAVGGLRFGLHRGGRGGRRGESGRDLVDGLHRRGGIRGRVLRCPALEQPHVRLQARRPRDGAAVLVVLHRLHGRAQHLGQLGLGHPGRLPESCSLGRLRQSGFGLRAGQHGVHRGEEFVLCGHESSPPGLSLHEINPLLHPVNLTLVENNFHLVPAWSPGLTERYAAARPRIGLGPVDLDLLGTSPVQQAVGRRTAHPRAVVGALCGRARMRLTGRRRLSRAYRCRLGCCRVLPGRSPRCGGSRGGWCPSCGRGGGGWGCFGGRRR